MWESYFGWNFLVWSFFYKFLRLYLRLNCLKGPYKPSYFITITSGKTKFKRFMRQNKTSCLENWIQFEIALILENDLKAVGIVKNNSFRFAVFLVCLLSSLRNMWTIYFNLVIFSWKTCSNFPCHQDTNGNKLKKIYIFQ